MSLYINFEAHSWYRGFAIKKNGNDDCEYYYHGRDTDGTRWYQCTVHDQQAPSPDFPCEGWERHSWYAVTDNGMTGYLVEFEADTLKELKAKITGYRSK